MKIENILVPVDLSTQSDPAVEYALFLAETTGAKITFLHVRVQYEDDVREEARFGEYPDRVREKESRVFNELQLRNKKAKKKQLELEFKIEWGHSAEEGILGFALEGDFDLIVIASHRNKALTELMLGSVAREIVRASPVPVVSLHNTIRKYAIESILVPVDFSECSKNATKVAISLASLYKSKLFFLHVIDGFAHPTIYTGKFTDRSESYTRLTQKLEEFVGLSGSGAEYLIASGISYDEIIDYTKLKKCDLLVMGAKGLGGPEHLFLGGTAKKVILQSTIPVMTAGRED